MERIRGEEAVGEGGGRVAVVDVGTREEEGTGESWGEREREGGIGREKGEGGKREDWRGGLERMERDEQSQKVVAFLQRECEKERMSRLALERGLVCWMCVCVGCVCCMCMLYVCVVCVYCMCLLYVCVVCVCCMCVLYVCVVCVCCMCVLHRAVRRLYSSDQLDLSYVDTCSVI